MKKYIISIDAGTTSNRAILFDLKGKPVFTSQKEFTQFFPKSGWVEHNPEEIWNTTKKVLKDVILKSKKLKGKILTVGITNQRETTVLWDKKTSKPIYNAIVWQDRRQAEYCKKLKKQNKETLIFNKTGLPIDSYFSGTKIKWILDENPELRQAAEKGELAFGTVDSWLIWNLTDGTTHTTDVTNASRTLLFNIHTLEWDNELLSILDIPKSLLPDVVSCSEIVGVTKLFGEEIPISGIAGDQQAALFGQMCINEGDVKNTYGTGCFCIMNTGEKAVASNNKMLTTIGYQLNEKITYALEGSIFTAGALVQWLRDQMQIISDASEIEALAKSVENNGGITFVPALSGLGAPYWDPEATGTIIGITRGTQKGHIARAALESIALRTRDIIVEMEKDAATTFKSLKVDGGASKNNLLMQIQADLLTTEVVRPQTTEITALGAAFFAGLAIGFWKNIEELEKIWKKDMSFSPSNNSQKRRILDQWNARVSKAFKTANE